MTQHHHILMSLNVSCNNVPRNNVPHSNCSVPLQMVISKEDGPLDDQNQRDELAQIVANEHLDDPASSVLLSVHLQMVICKEDGPPD